MRVLRDPVMRRQVRNRAVYDICRPQTADRIDKENSINSDVIINNISRAK